MATTFIEPGTDATQDFSLFLGTVTGGTGPAITSATDQSYTGGHSIKSLFTGGTIGQAFAYTPNAVVSDTGGVISARYRFGSLPGANTTCFTIAAQASNGIGILGIGISSAGQIVLQGRGVAAVSSAGTYSINTWYRISYGYVITSSSNWTAVCRIYDTSNSLMETLNASNTQGTLSAVTTSGVFFGISTPSAFASVSSPMTLWIDDIYISNATNQADPGNISVTAKRPFANGTTTGFTTQIGSGGSGYGTGHTPQVNERPLSTTNGWSMVGAGAAVTEEYTIEGAEIGDVSMPTNHIIDYMGWIWAKSLAGETASIILNNVTSNAVLTTTAALYTAIAGSTIYPAGGTDIGIITTTALTTVSLYECGIVFAYIPKSSTTWNNYQFASASDNGNGVMSVSEKIR